MCGICLMTYKMVTCLICTLVPLNVVSLPSWVIWRRCDDFENPCCLVGNVWFHCSDLGIQRHEEPSFVRESTHMSLHGMQYLWNAGEKKSMKDLDPSFHGIIQRTLIKQRCFWSSLLYVHSWAFISQLFFLLDVSPMEAMACFNALQFLGRREISVISPQQ